MSETRSVCSPEFKYSEAGKNKQWIHPEAVCVRDGDYSDTYECPVCGLRFEVELPE